ncbi:hypothetical protein Tco_1280781 [Tanacetum coccineum]
MWSTSRCQDFMDIQESRPAFLWLSNISVNMSFFGWVDALMCPRSVEIIHGLLRRLNGLEEVVDLFEEQRSKYKKYIIIS